jgi:branched-chain amino acid transport system permease protein
VILGGSRLVQERSGRAFRMIREHELIAPTLGISVQNYKLILFTLSSMVFGLAGALQAHFTGAIATENFPLLLAFQYVVMIVIGGLDSIAGAVIGAAIVVALPAWVPKVVAIFLGKSDANTYGPNIALIIYGVLVIFFVTSSPNGIIGLVRRVRRGVAGLLSTVLLKWLRTPDKRTEDDKGLTPVTTSINNGVAPDNTRMVGSGDGPN